MKVEYSSNNSGGSWWLSDDDWHALEAGGWDVAWVTNEDNGGLFKRADGDGRWLGALATSAAKEFDSEEDAIKDWERIVKQDAEEEGCSCCGQPHYFYGRSS